MDSLGDYIYIVLIAIAALSSIFKKKKEQPAPQADADSSSDDFEDLLRELLPQKKTAPVAQPEAAIEKKSNNTVISYENTSDFGKLKAKKQVTKQTADIKTHEKEKPIATASLNAEDRVTIQTPEDAKRAFIYAEIFNRKYWFRNKYTKAAFKHKHFFCFWENSLYICKK